MMTSQIANARVREITCGPLGDPLLWPDTQTITTTEAHIAKAQRIKNALSTQDGTAGGYLTPEPTIAEIVEVNLAEASVMRAVCNVVPGGHIRENFPVLDDGATEGRIGGNNEAATETDVAFAGRNSIGCDFRSDLIRVPRGLVQDSPALAARLLSALSRRVGRRQNRAFTAGTAPGPVGILSAATVGVTTATNSAILIDEMVELVTCLDSEYIAGASLMINPTLYGTLRKLKNGSGEYLWAAAGLDRYRVAFNSHMPSAITAGTKVALFGDFKRAYTIRELQTRLWTFTERYADLDQLAYEVTQIADGFLTDSAAVRALKVKD